MNDDDERQARIDEILSIHTRITEDGDASCASCGEDWPCDPAWLLAEVERLEAERDAARVRLLEREETERVRTNRQIATFKRLVTEKQELRAERDAATARAERAELDHRATYAVLSRFSHAVQQTRWPKMDNSQWQAVIDLAHGRPITVLIAEARAALAGSREQVAANPISDSGESSRLSE